MAFRARRAVRWTFPIALMVFQPAPSASAQSPPPQEHHCRAAVRAAGGPLKPYLDEPLQFAGGASVRVCLISRISIEPEVVMSPGGHYERLTAASNVLVDLSRPGGDVVPYALGGIGYGREQDVHVDWHRTYLALYGGVGVKIQATDSVFIAPEFRIGDDLFLVLVGVGYQFGRR